jgi:hypothetical protein
VERHVEKVIEAHDKLLPVFEVMKMPRKFHTADHDTDWYKEILKQYEIGNVSIVS